jgi:hypothetical protein
MDNEPMKLLDGDKEIEITYRQPSAQIRKIFYNEKRIAFPQENDKTSKKNAKIMLKYLDLSEVDNFDDVPEALAVKAMKQAVDNGDMTPAEFAQLLEKDDEITFEQVVESDLSLIRMFKSLINTDKLAGNELTKINSEETSDFWQTQNIYQMKREVQFFRRFFS